jgi:adenine-specific DNA-methyltransferase
MPTLTWVGKDKVVNHHHDVPFRILNKQYSFAANNHSLINSTQNRIIQGDNLEALKSLLPEFEGKVKCIYIDPPYNTGNEGWVYNDNVNDPKMKKWLGQVVGKEGEDLSRHDKWLCMMYPRLKLLHKLLADDGVIFVSIDDNEQANLKLIMDEIWGAGNFLASIAWEKRYTRSNNAKLFYSLKDTILVYRKSHLVSELKEGRTEKADANYNNPDNDIRGSWMTSSYINPATNVIIWIIIISVSFFCSPLF